MPRLGPFWEYFQASGVIDNGDEIEDYWARLEIREQTGSGTHPKTETEKSRQLFWAGSIEGDVK